MIGRIANALIAPSPPFPRSKLVEIQPATRVQSDSAQGFSYGSDFQLWAGCVQLGHGPFNWRDRNAYFRQHLGRTFVAPDERSLAPLVASGLPTGGGNASRALRPAAALLLWQSFWLIRACGLGQWMMTPIGHGGDGERHDRGQGCQNQCVDPLHYSRISFHRRSMREGGPVIYRGIPPLWVRVGSGSILHAQRDCIAETT